MIELNIMSHPSVLINCGNLHVGGGVAVATSFIDCLSRSSFEDIDIHLLLSQPVHKNLVQLKVDFDKFASCKTKDYFGLSSIWNGIDAEFKGFSVVFTVFGPAYFAIKSTRHVIGFAQPNIIYPYNPISRSLSPIKRFTDRLKYNIQARFFSRADCLIVELEHVEKGLRRLPFFNNHAIRVVYSSVHSVFLHQDQWSPIPPLPEKIGKKLGIISRNYPHKNLSVLPVVKQILKSVYNFDISFYVTFQPDEWGNLDFIFQESIHNVGGLTLSQCPSFYNAMDGVIFPSLLECFSAVPLEAMISKRPLFASDLSFIRDVCDTHCQYFDPHNPRDIARAIFEYFERSELGNEKQIELAYQHARHFPPPEKRAEEYLNIVREFANTPPQ